MLLLFVVRLAAADAVRHEARFAKYKYNFSNNINQYLLLFRYLRWVRTGLYVAWLKAWLVRSQTACAVNGYPTLCPLSLCPPSLCPGHFVPWSLCPRSLCPRSPLSPVTLSPGHFVPRSLCPPVTLSPVTLSPGPFVPRSLCPLTLYPQSIVPYIRFLE
jgi:hypothetical protein